MGFGVHHRFIGIYMIFHSILKKSKFEKYIALHKLVLPCSFVRSVHPIKKVMSYADLTYFSPFIWGNQIKKTLSNYLLQCTWISANEQKKNNSKLNLNVKRSAANALKSARALFCSVNSVVYTPAGLLLKIKRQIGDEHGRRARTKNKMNHAQQLQSHRI